MSLFAAGIALLALLFASYGRRSAWLALGSTMISMAAIIGCLFVITSPDQSQVRTRLAWIGSKVQPMLDRQTVDDLKTVIEYVSRSSSCHAGQGSGCKATASPEPPPAGRGAMQAAATTSWLGTKQDAEPAKQYPEPTKQASKAISQYPVAWLLDEPHVQVSSSNTQGFLISGTNVADQALEQVHAVLKPYSSKSEVDLVLNVDGHNAGDGAVIPAGARFSLVSETPNEGGSKQFGGAILTFRYIQAGQRKTSILYLTPSIVARLANRG